MRIFIHARTTITMVPPILWDTIQALVCAYVKQEGIEIIVVGAAIPASFSSFYNPYKQVKIVSFKEVLALYKSSNEARILHFGLHIKGAKGIPQVFIPLDFPKQKSKNAMITGFILKWQYSQWLKNAQHIVCINDWVYEAMQTRYPQFESKFTQVFLPVLPVPKFEWKHLQAAKENLTNGNQYFLCFAPLSWFTDILKEFSIFKKWQQTTMHLVFVFDTKSEVDAAMQKLKGYKFKTSITIKCEQAVSNEWIAAAYAILWEDVSFAKSSWMKAAIAYDIPLLFDTAMHLPHSWLNAGESFSFAEQQALSNHFKLYYKDEMYRQAMAEKGKAWLLQLNELAIEQGSSGMSHI